MTDDLSLDPAVVAGQLAEPAEVAPAADPWRARRAYGFGASDVPALLIALGYYAPDDDWWTVDRVALRRTATAAFGLFGAPTYVCVMTVQSAIRPFLCIQLGTRR